MGKWRPRFQKCMSRIFSDAQEGTCRRLSSGVAHPPEPKVSSLHYLIRTNTGILLDGGIGSSTIFPRILTAWPREREQNTAQCFPRERCRGAAIWGTMPITDLARTREIRHRYTFTIYALNVEKLN